MGSEGFEQAGSMSSCLVLKPAHLEGKLDLLAGHGASKSPNTRSGLFGRSCGSLILSSLVAFFICLVVPGAGSQTNHYHHRHCHDCHHHRDHHRDHDDDGDKYNQMLAPTLMLPIIFIRLWIGVRKRSLLIRFHLNGVLTLVLNLTFDIWKMVMLLHLMI